MISDFRKQSGDIAGLRHAIFNPRITCSSSVPSLRAQAQIASQFRLHLLKRIIRPMHLMRIVKTAQFLQIQDAGFSAWLKNNK